MADEEKNPSLRDLFSEDDRPKRPRLFDETDRSPRPSLFQDEDRPTKPRVFNESEKRRFCRYCRHYVVNPFVQRCMLHRKEVEATDTCDRFEDAAPPNTSFSS